MKLEEIGFGTLCDDRAKNVSPTSPLWRASLLITSRCNFRCPYCNGLSCGGDVDHDWLFYIMGKMANLKSKILQVMLSLIVSAVPSSV